MLFLHFPFGSACDDLRSTEDCGRGNLLDLTLHLSGRGLGCVCPNLHYSLFPGVGLHALHNGLQYFGGSVDEIRNLVRSRLLLLIVIAEIPQVG